MDPQLFEQTARARADKGRVRIRNSIGSPVEGQNFFNRDKEQAQLWHRLETDHVLLLAPRRVGKTSLLYRLEATAERHRFKSIYELLRKRGATHDLTRYILGVLVNDGYLVSVDERWCFRSPLLRDYWRSMVLA